MKHLIGRHELILSMLQKKSYVSVVDLCKELKVSSVTVRKDLHTLEQKNLIFKTHGGATINNPYIVDKHINEKEKIQSVEKTKIGIAAAALIEVNDSFIIASGTTVLALAKSMEPKKGLTVITSALNVVLELQKHTEIEILQLGGFVRKTSSSVTGAYAEKILKDFYCSKFFLGVDGIDLDFGLTTTSATEAHLNRQMMEVSQKTIVLADSTKFGKRGFGKICNINEVSHIITDNGIDDQIVKKLKILGIEVTIV